MTRFSAAAIFLLLWSINFSAFSEATEYSWLETNKSADALASRILVPEGYERTPVPEGSFQHWLRHLPLKPEGTPVYLFNGAEKSTQQVHVAVVNLDIGTRDLQQCADAVIRLRAEYLYTRKQYEKIHFNFTSGDTASFSRWIQGYRPHVTGNTVRWTKNRDSDSSYQSFKSYLKTVFMYAGSSSLEQELSPIENIQEMQIGDVFIQGGFPGHAVLVVDMARHTKTGKKVFMLAQSYMPAQDVHILRNPSIWRTTPWYELNFGEELRTPEWIFQKIHLKRFHDD